jgi:hypothetical protein
MDPQEHDVANKATDAAFKTMSDAYDAYLLLYSSPNGGGTGVTNTKQNQTENKIRKWESFDLSFFDDYMDALVSKPALMQEYIAVLETIDGTNPTWDVL